MRIFAMTPMYPPRSLVGSWMATHSFLRGLNARGHEVFVMPWMQRPEAAHDFEGIRIVPRSKDVVQHVERANVVISHLGDNRLAHKLAGSRGIPSVRMLHAPNPDAASMAKGAALIVANSMATAQACGLPKTIVCSPPTWPGKHTVTPGEAVTLVNLSALKGAELFYTLAEAMPDTWFLGVRGAYGVQIVRELPNVSIIETQADMRVVWSSTRVLLMPSEKEAWGMTGVEAMCSGIPVIANPTPGLRESLGSAGIFIDRDRPGEWQHMLSGLVKRVSAWKVASKLAKARVAELDPQASVDKFCDAVEAIR